MSIALAGLAVASSPAALHAAGVGLVIGGESASTQTVRVGEVLETPSHVGLARLGVAGWTSSGLQLGAGWRGGPSHRSQELGGFGSRIDEDRRGFWLRAGWRVPVAERVSAQLGGEFTYLECQSVLHNGANDPSASSVERSVAAPATLAAAITRRLSLEIWAGPAWVWGLGSDEYTGYYHRWELWAFSAGVELTVGVLNFGDAGSGSPP